MEASKLSRWQVEQSKYRIGEPDNQSVHAGAHRFSQMLSVEMSVLRGKTSAAASSAAAAGSSQSSACEASAGHVHAELELRTDADQEASNRAWLNS